MDIPPHSTLSSMQSNRDADDDDDDDDDNDDDDDDDDVAAELEPWCRRSFRW